MWWEAESKATQLNLNAQFMFALMKGRYLKHASDPRTMDANSLAYEPLTKKERETLIQNVTCGLAHCLAETHPESMHALLHNAGFSSECVTTQVKKLYKSSEACHINYEISSYRVLLSCNPFAADFAKTPIGCLTHEIQHILDDTLKNYVSCTARTRKNI
jgi:hypothetical protein